MSVAAVSLIFALGLSAPPDRQAELKPTLGAPRSVPAAAPASSQRGSSSHAATRIGDCLVYLLEDIQVPALEAGAIKEIAVQEGAIVTKGQRLALLDDREPKIKKLAAERERDAALAKAGDDVEVRFAEASLAFSTAELNRLLSIERKGANSVAQTEVEKAKLARERDALQIEKSKLDLKVAKMKADVHQADVDSAELSLARRQIVAPIDGEVVTVFHERQEWVSAGEPVVQLVRMDRLRVEGFAATSALSVSEISGRNVVVEVSLAHGRTEKFNGQVVFVSPIVTAGGKYRVRAEVENRLENNEWLLRPGMSAGMSIGK